MATAALTPGVRARLTAAVDVATSSLLHYDLSRTDIVKWVYFARQVFLVILLSVVTIAGLSAFMSIKQAGGLLRGSLESEARILAGATARAAFVPMVLEDERSLAALVDASRTVANVGSLRIRDAAGLVRREFRPARPETSLLLVEVPILPVVEAEPARPARAPKPVGFVEVGMRTEWIDDRARTIALTNVAVSGLLAAVVAIVGMLVIGKLVDRTRELVGEARLVDEVKRVNAELETFSYSVAHDLRAPLRSIDGFSQAVLEDCAGKLPPDSAANLGRVRAASQRMAELIDDILELSRVSRVEMRRERVDLSVLARSIADEVRSGDRERRAEVSVASGLVAEGDARLLRLVLQNLIGNAWKFTSKVRLARIEVAGFKQADGSPVFYVRDNGAGFDPAYAHKLFGTFQRLHDAAEYPGTGVGLSTVQRIVHRHRGRVWAEGAPGRGATFYFTIPDPAKRTP